LTTEGTLAANNSAAVRSWGRRPSGVVMVVGGGGGAGSGGGREGAGGGGGGTGGGGSGTESAAVSSSSSKATAARSAHACWPFTVILMQWPGDRHCACAYCRLPDAWSAHEGKGSPHCSQARTCSFACVQGMHLHNASTSMHNSATQSMYIIAHAAVTHRMH
jgi:hypothetical protein